MFASASASTRHLAYADALEAIYDSFFQGRAADVDKPAAGAYGSMVSSLRGATTDAADDSDEALAASIDEFTDGYEQMGKAGTPLSLDVATLREIARLVCSGELLGPAIDAAAARWHRDRQQELMAQLESGQVEPDGYERWNAKMETHRVSAGHFDGYADAPYRFSKS
jgi:hypothetical protein